MFRIWWCLPRNTSLKMRILNQCCMESETQMKEERGQHYRDKTKSRPEEESVCSCVFWCELGHLVEVAFKSCPREGGNNQLNLSHKPTPVRIRNWFTQNHLW